MLETIVIIFLIAYLIRSLKAILSLVFLWQLKEYRLDRMLAHLKTSQGKKVILNPFSLFKWFLITGYLFFGLRTNDELWFYLITIIVIGILPLIIYLIEGLWGFLQIIIKGWLTPKLTIKSLMLVIGSIGFICLTVYLIYSSNNWLLYVFALLIIDKLLAPFIALMVALLAIPSIIYKKYLISKAKKKLEGYSHLKVIGITGSYGKTSTKEFLSQILSAKFKVLKTPASNNTTWGVIKTILNDLTDQEIFVVEMGAYRIGEIREICQIVKPQIGIITGINEQHLDLFGSLEKTIAAKYELIESLPKDGLAVFNGSNEKCRELYEKTKQIGQITQIRLIGKDIKADEIKIFKDKLEFKAVKGLKFQKMAANLLGGQNIENLLLAITVADYLGMSLEEISKAVEKIEAPERTMKLHNNLVNDTFNTNPDGVIAALEYMKVYPGKKILVLTPMIELGKFAKEAHRKVAKLAAEVCDLVILTNKNYYREFKGKVWVGGGEKAVKKIREMLDKDGVAVFEGKETVKILEKFRKNDY